jgi:hypothetical protein
MVKTVGEQFTGADISAELLEHIRSGVRTASYVEGHRADPMFALGSDKSYDVAFCDGSRFLLTLWGNTDGWGILQAKAPSHVPAVADVIRVRGERNCSQIEAVEFLGGTP